MSDSNTDVTSAATEVVESSDAPEKSPLELVTEGVDAVMIDAAAKSKKKKKKKAAEPKESAGSDLVEVICSTSVKLLLITFHAQSVAVQQMSDSEVSNSLFHHRNCSWGTFQIIRLIQEQEYKKQKERYDKYQKKEKGEIAEKDHKFWNTQATNNNANRNNMILIHALLCLLVGIRSLYQK